MFASSADTSADSPCQELSAGFIAISCLLVILSLLFFYWPCLIGLEDYCLSDITYYFEPFTRFMAEALKAGRLPLWNPFVYCGMSQIAVPSPGLIYPGTFLMMALSFSKGLALYMLLHQLIAGLGAFLLVRSLRWGNFPALIAGLIACYCGYMFSLVANHTLMATAAWLPLCLYSIRKTNADLSSLNILRFIASSLSTFMLISVGRPEISFPCLLIIGAYLFFSPLRSIWRNKNRAKCFRIFLFRALAVGFGFLLALPVILPALEWLQISPRSHGLHKRWVLMWSANWFDWLNILLGYPLGDICALGPDGSQFRNFVVSRPKALPFLTSAYLGPVAVTLAAWGLFDKKWTSRWIIFACGAILALLALGNYSPFAPAFISLSPLFAAFRYPVKLLVFPAFILGLMAARGAQLCAEKRITANCLIVSVVFWILLLVFGSIMVLSKHSDLLQYAPWFVGKTALLPLMETMQMLIGKSLITTASLALLFCTICVLYFVGKINYKIFSILLILELSFSMFYCSYANARHTVPVGHFETPCPLAERLHVLIKQEALSPVAAKRVLSLYLDPLSLPKWLTAGKGSNYDKEYYQYSRQILLPNCNSDYGIAESSGYEAAETTGYKDLFRKVFALSSQNYRSKNKAELTDYPLSRFCKLTSTKFVITQSYFLNKASTSTPPLDANLFELVEDMRFINVKIYRVKNASERIYFANTVREIASWKNFHDLVCDIKNKTLVATEFTYVEPSSKNLVAETTKGSPEKSNSSCKLVVDEPEKLELEATVNKPQLLVIADQYYPGWQLEVDGKPSTIIRTNLFSRAVALAPGKHRISFQYKPASFFMGIYLALSAFVIEILFLIVVFLKAKIEQLRPKENVDSIKP